MKHTIYQSPHTQKFAVIKLPPDFSEGDRLPIPATSRWFTTREQALAALVDLQQRDY
jgi:hypothetical protein